MTCTPEHARNELTGAVRRAREQHAHCCYVAVDHLERLLQDYDALVDELHGEDEE